MKSPGLFLLLLLSVIVGSGCEPEPMPVWNHDSQSFFYTCADGSVRQHDFNSDKSRLLVGGGDHRPRTVALNPVRPELILANATLGPQFGAVQIGTASLSANDFSWGNSAVWGDENASRIIVPTASYWCPQQQKVLTWFAKFDLQSSGPALGRAALYDCQTSQWRELQSAPPAVPLAQAFHVSPVAPDGSGYLAMKLPAEGPMVSFVDWDGWETPLPFSPELQKAYSMDAQTLFSKAQTEREIRFRGQGRWNGNVLEVPLRKGLVRFDVALRRVTLTPLPADDQQEIDVWDALDREDAPWFTTEACRFGSGSLTVLFRQHVQKETHRARIELFDRSRQRQRILLEGTVPAESFVHRLIPSPDRRLLLISLDQGEDSMIHVIRSNGEIVSSLKTGVLSSRKPGP